MDIITMLAALAQALITLTEQIIAVVEEKDSATILTNLNASRDKATLVAQQIAELDTARAAATEATIDAKIASLTPAEPSTP